LAERINQDYAGRDLVMIGVLKGAFIFLADLVRALPFSVEVDFVRLKSYVSGTQSSGEIVITKDVETPLKDREVLIVEDIVDLGLTLDFLRKHLLTHHPRSLKICCFIDKRERRQVEVPLDYVGFVVEKGFLVGYGLDCGEQNRTLPDIYALEPESGGGQGTAFPGPPPKHPPLKIMPRLRFAALDIGSLTVRLAVAEATGPGRFRVLKHLREVTGLAQGLAQTGSLAPEAMERTHKALAGFMQVLQKDGVEHYQAVATHAVRQAQNGPVFLDRLRESLKLTVRVLSPAEEARLALLGVLSVLAPEFLAGEEVAVFDVGGGSSEWALLRPGHAPEFASLPLGVLTLSQAQPLGDPPEPPRVKALNQYLEEKLQKFYQKFFQPRLEGPPRLVGTAGAVTTLAALSLKMSKYDPNKVNNMIMTRAQVAGLAEQLAGLTEAQRALLPGMEAAKAGVMVAGALIILTILQVFKQDLLVVIDAGLLEGVLEQMAVGGGG
jgi:hypoxanthine phosphoribosyltransferase